MRALILGAAFVLAATTVALAEDPAPAPTPAEVVPPESARGPNTVPVAVPEALAPAIGNTWKVVDAKGLESHTYFAADGTFSGVAPAYSYHYQGKWEIAADGQLCRNFDPVPPGIVNPVCSKLEPHAVGDSWTDPDGASGTLLAGQQ
jgi:hypothetical protein